MYATLEEKTVIRLTLITPILAAFVGIAGWKGVRAGEFDVHYGEIYAKRKSGPLRADIYVPQGEGPFPGVLVIHGGAWYIGTRAQLSGIAQRLALNGMTAMAISYRLAPRDKFPAQIEDCKTAVRWMRSGGEKWRIDPERIGAFGYSAGAQLAALLGTTDPEDGLEGHPATFGTSTRLQAVVGGGTPTDFRHLPLDNRMLSFWLGGTRRERGEQYRLASPRAFVTPDDPPMFFFHGENDRLVPLQSSKAMCQSLTDAGVPNEFYLVPKIGHNFAVMDLTALDKSVDFLAQNLTARGDP